MEPDQSKFMLGRFSVLSDDELNEFHRLAEKTVTGVGLLLSAIPPLQAAAGVGTTVWLLVLHGIVAAAVLPPDFVTVDHRGRGISNRLRCRANSTRKPGEGRRCV